MTTNHNLQTRENFCRGVKIACAKHIWLELKDAAKRRIGLELGVASSEVSDWQVAESLYCTESQVSRFRHGSLSAVTMFAAATFFRWIKIDLPSLDDRVDGGFCYAVHCKEARQKRDYPTEDQMISLFEFRVMRGIRETLASNKLEPKDYDWDEKDRLLEGYFAGGENLRAAYGRWAELIGEVIDEVPYTWGTSDK